MAEALEVGSDRVAGFEHHRPEAAFADFGLDSLGLLGIVGELENRHGRPMPPEADQCKTPHAFLDLVNNSLMTGA